MSSLKKGVTIDQQTVYVDPLLLFTRLVMLLGRSEDMSSYFQYELTPVSTSLFKEHLMRKPNKSALANYLIASVDTRKRKISDSTRKSGKKFCLEKRTCNDTNNEESGSQSQIKEQITDRSMTELPKESHFVLEHCFIKWFGDQTHRMEK